LRTILALVAALAILLGWAKSWGWPGDLVLSVTQFPFAWLVWSVIGFLVGRCIYLSKQRSPLAAHLFLLTCVAILLVGWARMRSFRLWLPREETLTWPDYWIVQVDYWLRSRVETPDFWKRNCTHSPVAIVLGIALAILTAIGGLLMRFQKLARSLAIFSAFGLALALLFYVLDRCMMHDRPDDYVLLVLVTVPMIFATTGFPNAWRHVREAQRAGRVVEPEL
jgi:hypothetical protein